MQIKFLKPRSEQTNLRRGINYEYLGHNVTFPLEEMRESTFCRTPGGFRGKCFLLFWKIPGIWMFGTFFGTYFELFLLCKYSPSSLTRAEFWVSGKRKHWYWNWH